MFEGSNAAYTGFLEGVNRRMAKDANAAVQSWKEAAAKWERNFHEAEALLEEANARLAEAQARVAELELALAVKTAHAGGMKAYRDAFKAAHPTSPVLSDSGRRYRDGSAKSRGALAYEAEFDRILRDARISDPAKYWAD